MAKPTRVPAPSHSETASRHRPLSRPSRPFGRPLPERTAPAILREAPWFAFNASTAPLVAGGPNLGPTRFLLGANVPFIQAGLDVGASPSRPEGGLHAHPDDAALLRTVFQQLRQDGVGFARFFLLGDGRSGVRFAEDGTPEGLDGAVFADLQVVLDAARTAGISLVLVLLDEGWLVPTELSDGRVVGGRAATLREVEKRSALLEKVLRPLLMHVGNDPVVLAWEVMHGPDRRTLGLHGNPEVQPHARRSWWREAVGRTWRRVGRALGLAVERREPPAWVGREQMREFLSEAVALVHRHTQALATVGVCAPAALELVRGLGLDYYGLDWGPEVSGDTLRLAVSDLRLDRPLLLGAFPGRHPQRSIKSLLDTARCAGHGGAFVWSVLQHDATAGYDGQLAQWSRNHGGHLFHRELPAPVRTVVDETPSRAEAPLALKR